MPFRSNANNLVSGDSNGSSDVFIKDLTGTTVRASTDNSGNQGNGDSLSPVLSSDGRYMAFVSVADNLIASDTNNRYDVFVKDLQAGVIVRASTGGLGGQSNNNSFAPTLSGDGRYVAFYSFASNLVLGDANGGTADVFIKDLHTGAIVLASTDSSGNQGNNDSTSPVLSSDGRYLAFQSTATNLVAGDTNATLDVFVKDLQTGMTLRDSTDNFGNQSNSGSSAPALSADGSYVAFTSTASNLVANDANSYLDVFGKDLPSGAVTLFSNRDPSIQSALFGNGSSDVAKQSINADGRYVAFQSNASNLVTGDTNAASDVFIEDLLTGSIILASANSSGIEGNNSSFNPAISADGRYLAFESLAGNLVAGDSNGSSDVFVKDLQTGVVGRASTSTSGTEGNSDSYGPALSADGRHVAFYSYSTNLVPGDTNAVVDVFVKDLQTGAIVRASADSTGHQGNSYSNSPALSDDGRYVAFQSNASNLVSGDSNGNWDVFVKDLQTGNIVLASSDSIGNPGNNGSLNPALSADGRYVAFDSVASNLVAGDSNGTSDVFVKDLQSGATTLASTDSLGSQGNGGAYRPTLSSDGRHVAFYSDASNLVPGDTNGFADVFVKDLQTNAILRANVDNAGPQGNAGSFNPVLGADASRVIFTSNASNLLADDTNANSDVFLATLPVHTANTATNVSVTPGLGVFRTAGTGTFELTADVTNTDDGSDAIGEGTVTLTILDALSHVVDTVSNVAVIAGQADYSSYSLPAGTPVGSYTVAAEYSGSSNYASSVSAAAASLDVLRRTRQRR